MDIYGHILIDNHYHLILGESVNNGIPEFMRKLANSYVAYIRHKYDREKRLFKGRYESSAITGGNQPEILFVYVLVKNAFERYPDGLRAAIDDFDEAFAMARKYEFSALGGLMGDRQDDIINRTCFDQLFESPQEFKKFARDQMSQYKAFLNNVGDISLE